MDSTLRLKRRRNRLAAALLMFATMTNGSACANNVAQRAHNRALVSATKDYRHTGNRSAVAGDIRTLLVDRGFAIAIDTPQSIVTEWLPRGDETRDRLAVTLRSKGSGLAVRIDREQQQKMPPAWTPLSSKRDYDVEAETLDGIYPGKSETLSASAVLGFEYRVDPQILWDATLTALQGRGHWMPSGGPPVDVTTASEWVTDDSDPPRRVRYEVTIESSGTARRLKVHRVIEKGVGSGTWQIMQRRRDANVELALIAARDPTGAAEIEAEADEEARRAFQAARDAGLASCG